jgi:hypothetical protein
VTIARERRGQVVDAVIESLLSRQCLAGALAW